MNTKTTIKEVDKVAINKEKNVCIQVTFSKEEASKLDTLKESFNKEGIRVTRSDILAHALDQYIKMLVMCDKISEADKVEEPQGEQENA